MNRLGRLLIIVLLLLAVVGVYFSVRSMILNKRTNEQAAQTISASLATTTASSTNQTDSNYTIDLPRATTTTPTTWKTYTNTQLGYSISYPRNLILSAASDTLTLSFPKEIYFHWPLLDDVTLKITASSTCPDMMVPTGPFTATTTFSLNGYSFNVTEGDDAGAGNRYQEIAYDTFGNNACYHISMFDHGVNGAGFYVEGQALIQKYDNQHDTDMQAVISILNSATNSFRLQAIDVVQ